jgi:2-polyprenyl-3-methyl-5-hydroxy-6-metoxy-1,4-benzoquinol methylase
MTAAPFQQVPIDAVRDYWNRRPCNIRHSAAPVGSRQYFDEVRDRKYFVEPHIPGFADFPRWEGKRVLEVGCGIGTDTISFAEAGANVTAVDLSDASLKVARQRAEVYGLADRIRFHHANAERLSDAIPVEPYDLVYSFGVLHHTPDPDAAFEQVRQYLAPGGTLKVMLYHRHCWKAAQILARSGFQFWKMDQLIACHSEAQTGCPVTYSYSRRTGRELLERHGLTVRDIAVDHIFPYRVKDYVQYRYVKQWPIGCLPAPLFRVIERRLGWHLCLTAERVS